MSDVKYIRNDRGGVHSVTLEHWEKYLTTVTDQGNRFPLPGFEEISEAQARKAAPTLFGGSDPQVESAMTDAEVAAQLARKKAIREMREEEARTAAAVEGK